MSAVKPARLEGLGTLLLTSFTKVLNKPNGAGPCSQGVGQPGRRAGARRSWAGLRSTGNGSSWILTGEIKDPKGF